MSFFVTLQSNFQHVMIYENPELQEKARSHIPHQDLSSAAEQKLKQAKEADPGTTKCHHPFLKIKLNKFQSIRKYIRLAF